MNAHLSIRDNFALAKRKAARRLGAADTESLPSNDEVEAELRDYQAEGFVWMAHLAHLGVGACLADAMGLGKTLQSLR